MSACASDKTTNRNIERKKEIRGGCTPFNFEIGISVKTAMRGNVSFWLTVKCGSFKRKVNNMSVTVHSYCAGGSFHIVLTGRLLDAFFVSCWYRNRVQCIDSANCLSKVTRVSIPYSQFLLSKFPCDCAQGI